MLLKTFVLFSRVALFSWGGGPASLALMQTVTDAVGIDMLYGLHGQGMPELLDDLRRIIKQLEAHYGVRLFDRLGKRLSLLRLK